jgi:hypothetical protein
VKSALKEATLTAQSNQVTLNSFYQKDYLSSKSSRPSPLKRGQGMVLKKVSGSTSIKPRLRNIRIGAKNAYFVISSPERA